MELFENVHAFRETEWLFLSSFFLYYRDILLRIEVHEHDCSSWTGAMGIFLAGETPAVFKSYLISTS